MLQRKSASPVLVPLKQGLAVLLNVIHVHQRFVFAYVPEQTPECSFSVEY